jgi:L-ribulokinase
MAAPTQRTYLPDPGRSAVYDRLYAIYESTARHFALQSDALHALMALRHGGKR